MEDEALGGGLGDGGARFAAYATAVPLKLESFGACSERLPKSKLGGNERKNVRFLEILRASNKTLVNFLLVPPLIPQTIDIDLECRRYLLRGKIIKEELIPNCHTFIPDNFWSIAISFRG